MSVFEHSRFRVFNKGQHVLAHTTSDIFYSNTGMGTQVTNVQQALDWLFAVIYPKQKAQVATPAALPLAGNSIGDMRIVADDGDGKSAAYRWEQRDGELSPSWHKIYDMDWSTDSILASWMDETQDLFVNKYGRDDIDGAGNPYAGDLAGQHIFGGLTANTNLTMFANNGDGAGPTTGFIQFGDKVRPLFDNQFSLGQAAYRWSQLYSVTANIADFTFTNGSIISLSPTITFGSSNLMTTGRVTANNVQATGTASAFASGTTIADLTFSTGAIDSGSGQIDFNLTDLITMGDLFVSDLHFSLNVISSSTNEIDFNSNDLININNLTVNQGNILTGVFGTPGDTITINGSSITRTGGTSLALASDNGYDFQSSAGAINADCDINTLAKINAGDYITSTAGFLVDAGAPQKLKMYLSGGYGFIEATSLSLLFAGNTIEFQNNITPFGVQNIGDAISKWNNIYFTGSLVTATQSIPQGALNSIRKIHLRSTLAAPADGDSLFWNAAQQCWFADHPDTEINHSELLNLLVDSHTQYALLAGRSGGQTLTGGVNAGEALLLRSTSDATKGRVFFADTLAPFTDNATNIGESAKRVKDFYSAGQFIGLRLENQSTISEPAASALNIGRLYYNTSTQKMRIDQGGTWKDIGGAEKTVVQDGLNWNGTITTYSYNVAAFTTDATKCIWAFRLDSTCEQLYPRITATTTTVTVTFTLAPAAATYTLIGVG